MRWTTPGSLGTVTRSAVGGALIFLAAIFLAVAAPTQAFAMPATAGIFGSPVPLEPPTGPDDDSCISQPADPICGGGPYALPSPPTISIPSPAMDGGMPGITGIGGMPGQI